MDKNKFAGLMLLCGIWIAGCNESQGESQLPVSQDSTEPTRPNIVFIMADDLGYGHLGSYGQQVIETPEPDQESETK